LSDLHHEIEANFFPNNIEYLKKGVYYVQKIVIPVERLLISFEMRMPMGEYVMMSYPPESWISMAMVHRHLYPKRDIKTKIRTKLL